jgi:small subunit ribosomal protein S14
MAKKSMLEREKKRKILVNKFREKRELLKKELKSVELFDEKIGIAKKLQKLPKNSSNIRLRNRCWKTGRPRGYFRFFGLCRNAVREMGHECLLPGLTKSSW